MGIGKSDRSTTLPFFNSMISVLFWVYIRKNVMFGGLDTGINVSGGKVGDDTGVVGTTPYTIWNRVVRVLPVLDTVAVIVCVPIRRRLHRKNNGPSLPHRAYGALDSTRYCVTLFHPNTTDVMGLPLVIAFTPKLGVVPDGIVMTAPSNRLATTLLLPPCISSNPITCPVCAEVNLGNVTSATTATIIRLIPIIGNGSVRLCRFMLKQKIQYIHQAKSKDSCM